MRPLSSWSLLHTCSDLSRRMLGPSAQGSWLKPVSEKQRVERIANLQPASQASLPAVRCPTARAAVAPVRTRRHEAAPAPLAGLRKRLESRTCAFGGVFHGRQSQKRENFQSTTNLHGCQ